jgi:hypothetical protein
MAVEAVGATGLVDGGAPADAAEPDAQVPEDVAEPEPICEDAAESDAPVREDVAAMIPAAMIPQSLAFTCTSQQAFR